MAGWGIAAQASYRRAFLRLIHTRLCTLNERGHLCDCSAGASCQFTAPESAVPVLSAGHH